MKGLPFRQAFFVYKLFRFCPVHSFRSGFNVVHRGEKLPAAFFIKILVVRHEVKGIKAHFSHIVSGKVEKVPCETLHSVLRLNVKGAEIRGKVRAVVEIVRNHPGPGGNISVFIKYDVLLGYAVLVFNTFTDALAIGFKGYAPLLGEPKGGFFVKPRAFPQRFERVIIHSYSMGSKSAAPCLQSGQTKSSGRVSPS